MTHIEISNPYRVAELPGEHPPALTANSPNVGLELDAWYRWAARQGDQVVLRLAPRDYRTPNPIVWDAPNVSVMGWSPGVTRLVCPGVKIGGPIRAERREFGNFWVMSDAFYTRGQDGWPEFGGTGVMLSNLLDAYVHDIQAHGFGVGFHIRDKTARCHMDRLKANHARSTGFHFQGTDAASHNGADFLVDNRTTSCEVDSNWQKGHITENGFLFSGTSIGDQFLDKCGALSCKIGVKVVEPAVAGGYRYNINFVQSFLDYCTISCIDVRDHSDFRFTDGFIGVRGVVAIRAPRFELKDSYCGMLKDRAQVMDGVSLTECHEPRIVGNSIRHFGRGVNLIRSTSALVESNRVGPLWDGTPTTPGGHGIRMTGGSGHLVRANRIDTSGNTLVAAIANEGAQRLTVTDNVDHLGVPIPVTSVPILE